jgi:hypothetical protein
LAPLYVIERARDMLKGEIIAFSPVVLFGEIRFRNKLIPNVFEETTSDLLFSLSLRKTGSLTRVSLFSHVENNKIEENNTMYKAKYFIIIHIKFNSLL